MVSQLDRDTMKHEGYEVRLLWCVNNWDGTWAVDEMDRDKTFDPDAFDETGSGGYYSAEWCYWDEDIKGGTWKILRPYRLNGQAIVNLINKYKINILHIDNWVLAGATNGLYQYADNVTEAVCLAVCNVDIEGQLVYTDIKNVGKHG